MRFAVVPVQRIVLAPYPIPLVGQMVPGILLLPADVECPPAVLLLHGYGSRKEQMADAVGRALLDRKIASLAIDLPLHGERERTVEIDAIRNPLVLVSQWRMALAECGAALEWMSEQEKLDGHRLAIAGDSMGSFIGRMVAANTDHVRALVLAAGHWLPDSATRDAAAWLETQLARSR